MTYFVVSRPTSPSPYITGCLTKEEDIICSNNITIYDETAFFVVSSLKHLYFCLFLYFGISTCKFARVITTIKQGVVVKIK